MAKYTELFIEYVNGGGNLPALFDNIEGFKDLFIAHYCDKEIGFETEKLFETKLFAKAQIVIPYYIDKIAKYTAFYTKADNPVKVYYSKETTQYNIAEQKTKTTELPIDATTAEPSVVNVSEGYVNDDIKELRKEETDTSVDAVLKMLEFLNRDVTKLIEKLLDEFSNLFMKVY